MGWVSREERTLLSSIVLTTLTAATLGAALARPPKQTAADSPERQNLQSLYSAQKQIEVDSTSVSGTRLLTSTFAELTGQDRVRKAILYAIIGAREDLSGERYLENVATLKHALYTTDSR